MLEVFEAPFEIESTLAVELRDVPHVARSEDRCDERDEKRVDGSRGLRFRRVDRDDLVGPRQSILCAEHNPATPDVNAGYPGFFQEIEFARHFWPFRSIVRPTSECSSIS